MPEQQLLKNILTVIVQPAIGLLFLFAFVLFLWGVYKYMSGGSDPKKRSEGSKTMIYGVLGLAVMFGVNGIISFVAKSLSVPEKPKFEFPANLNIQLKK